MCVCVCVCLHMHACVCVCLRMRARVCVLRPTYPSTVFGPTCDGLDCILKVFLTVVSFPFLFPGSVNLRMYLQDVTLPLIECGEWVLFNNMGAYTRAASSNFNGFHQHTIYYVRT